MLLLVFSPLVFADNDKPPDNRPPDNRPPDRIGVGDITTTLDSEIVVNTSSESASDATATSTVTNNVSLFPSEGVSGQSTGTGNSIVSINEAERPDDITIRNTPSMVAPDIFPTVSCFKGTSFAIGVPGAGGSFGGGKIDPECTRREEIRLAAQIGLAAQALFRWCGLENNVLEFGSREGCMSYGNGNGNGASDPRPVPTQVTEDYVTEQELVIADEQIMGVVEQVDERLQGIERRLDANAAANRREARERDEWKAQLAARFLTEPDQ